MKLFKTVVEWGKLIVNTIVVPLCREWPLIALVTLLLGSSSHWVLHSVPTCHSSYPVSWITRFGVAFMLAYLWGILTLITPPKALKRLLRGIIIAFSALLFLTEGVVFEIWKLHISPALLSLAAETNHKEVTDIIDVLFNAAPFHTGLAVTAGLIALFFVACKFRERINRRVKHLLFNLKIHFPFKALTALLTVAMLGAGVTYSLRFSGIYRAQSVGALATWVVHSHEQQESCDNLSRLLFALRSLSLAEKETRGWARVQQRFLESGKATTQAGDSLQVVCIIGESFIRSHSSLYGYPLPTNPRLERLAHSTQGDTLVCFTDMATFTPRTSESLRDIFAVDPRLHSRNWFESVSFPVAFRRAGFNVNFADNQLTNASSHWAFSLAAVIAHPVLRHGCYTSMFVPENYLYDLEFADSALIVRENQPEGKSLDIIHLSGQHLWADYPRQPQWERFTANDVPDAQRPWLDDERRQRIADYDNATFYNDSVVARIINYYREREAVVIYFPDHGEEVYDYRDSALRKKPAEGNTEQYVDHVFRIPFFVWMSNSYHSRHPETAAAIINATERPGILSDISHTLLNIALITSPVYNPSLDILSPAYNPPPRQTSCGLPIPAATATKSH